MAFSKLTINALDRVAAGETPYAAAKAEGLTPSTIYRALKKIKSGEVAKEKRGLRRRGITINLSDAELQRCHEAAGRLRISRYKFMQLAVIEKIDKELAIAQ